MHHLMAYWNCDW